MLIKARNITLKVEVVITQFLTIFILIIIIIILFTEKDKKMMIKK